MFCVRAHSEHVRGQELLDRAGALLHVGHDPWNSCNRLLVVYYGGFHLNYYYNWPCAVTSGGAGVPSQFNEFGIDPSLDPELALVRCASGTSGHRGGVWLWRYSGGTCRNGAGREAAEQPGVGTAYGRCDSG